MTLRKSCSCCKKEITTKNSKHIGRNELGIWVNCKCGTTILLLSDEFKAERTRYMWFERLANNKVSEVWNE